MYACVCACICVGGVSVKDGEEREQRRETVLTKGCMKERKKMTAKISGFFSKDKELLSQDMLGQFIFIYFPFIFLLFACFILLIFLYHLFLLFFLAFCTPCLL